MVAAHAPLHVGSVLPRRARRRRIPAQKRSCRLTPRIVALAIITGIVVVGSLIGFLGPISSHDGPRAMDSRRSRLRAGTGLAVNGRRDLHNLYIPGGQWLGVFSRCSHPVQPWTSAFDLRHLVLHPSANLGSRPQATSKHKRISSRCDTAAHFWLPSWPSLASCLSFPMCNSNSLAWD